MQFEQTDGLQTVEQAQLGTGVMVAVGTDEVTEFLELRRVLTLEGTELLHDAVQLLDHSGIQSDGIQALPKPTGEECWQVLHTLVQQHRHLPGHEFAAPVVGSEDHVIAQRCEIMLHKEDVEPDVVDLLEILQPELATPLVDLADRRKGTFPCSQAMAVPPPDSRAHGEKKDALE